MIRSGSLFYLATAIFTVIGLNAPLLAQQTGGSGGVPTVDPGATQTTQAPATNGPATQGSFETGGDFDFGNLVDQLQIPEIPEIENTRNQPFVGRSIERFETLGIQAHPRSNAAAPGSVFSSGGGAGGRGFAGGRGGNAGQRGLQNGTGNSVVRRSLRTRLVPRITVNNPVTPEQVSNRFQQRLVNSQMVDNPMASVQVRVENKTAYLSGVVSSIDMRNRAERMARLEPGIYRIENKIEVQP